MDNIEIENNQPTNHMDHDNKDFNYTTKMSCLFIPIGGH